MKIYGIGVDIVKNSRLTRILQQKYAENFLRKTLNIEEISEISKKQSLEEKGRYLASRWSFKEAVVKASGRKDLIFSDMLLVKEDTGRPKIKFLDKNLIIMENELKITDSHVSISHEDEYSIAYVLLETSADQK